MRRSSIHRASRSLSALALALAPLALLTSPVDAQRRVTGVVHDSLRSQGPLAGAEVVLLGAGLRTRTDSLGRFAFATVPEGAQGVAYWAPWLDSLGLPPLRASLDAPTIILATPSRATFQRALCGTALDDGQGVLLGDVRAPDGMPQDSVLVLAEWQETAIGRGGIVRQGVATVDTTDAVGSYVLCGVPTEATVTLQAANSSRSTGALLVAIASHQQRLDLVVGADSERVRVTGRVLETVGDSTRTVPDATVSVWRDSSRTTRSNAVGAFDMNAPWRSHLMEIRAVGFQPVTAIVSPATAVVEIGTLTLTRVPPELDTIAVVADMFAHEREGFEHRRRQGIGRFVAEDQLRQYGTKTTALISSLLPSTRAEGRSIYAPLRLRQGPGWCSPRFFENGRDVGQLDEPAEQHNLFQRAKRIEVYSAAQAPPQFNDFDGCGAVVVWTR